ncbi:glycosyltransferase [Bacteroides sp. An322]|uniref:glycosyltransferase n=1 Tax=Bacteroides sp. An322 TaxID=1965632 RepID=UPI000B38DA8C|nr:glycosyltransferase [Bacteroides sp. An322]OUO13337.1 hypothetical protein B5F91_14480 [Bacteroides sp. An322]
MNGLIIWAYSYCRSTISFYLELGNFFSVPLKIYVWRTDYSLRENVGFSRREIEDNNIYILEEGNNFAINILKKHRTWNHIFTAYQNVPLFQKLMQIAISENIVYAIASEAPCNMYRFPLRFIKSLYISYILPYKLKAYIKNAEFIINFSGHYEREMLNLGWSQNKIISCGYYSPPIVGSQCIKRNIQNWENFTILLSGIHQWHRSPILLLKALNILKQRGRVCKCVITQEGPLLEELKKYALQHRLDNISFMGFVSLDKLIELYQTCSVYVGAGTNEPWGMRLNDVLQCGSPLVVNKGMGGSKLVDDYACGFTFERGNYRMLADCLDLLISNKSIYLEVAEKAYISAQQISPRKKAKEIADIIMNLFDKWH